MNYTIQEYANNIVYTLAEICAQHQLPCPNIITESGRAITAHHAMLITNIIASESAYEPTSLKAPEVDEAPILHNLWNCFSYLSASTVLEIYHDISHWMSEVHTMYVHGVIDLEKRAYAEQIHYAVCFKLKDYLKPTIRAHREVIDDLNKKLANKFVCNFSLFQSLPDAWAIDQVFPIMPLSGLDKPPTEHGILHDITCDSDGRIETYVNNYGLESTLPLLPFDPEQPYLLGIFLVGAYQEILGDMHNLFGDTNSVHVEVTDDGGFRLSHALQGDTVATSLRYVDFEEEALIDAYQRKLANAQITKEESALVLLPVPWEATTSYGGGTANGPRAIEKASKQIDLFDLELGNFFNAGIYMLPESEEVRKWNDMAKEAASLVIELHDEALPDVINALATVNILSQQLNNYVYQQTNTLLHEGKLVGLLGGDHSSPFGAIRAFLERYPAMGILHIDAHADLRDAYEGFNYSHASIMHNVITRTSLNTLVQVEIGRAH